MGCGYTALCGDQQTQEYARYKLRAREGMPESYAFQIQVEGWVEHAILVLRANHYIPVRGLKEQSRHKLWAEGNPE